MSNLPYLLLLAVSTTACSDAGVLQLDSGGSGGQTSTTGDAGSSGPTTRDLGGEPEVPQGPCAGPSNAMNPFHVRTDGNDETGDGSSSAPWATLRHAVANVPDGALIEVGPGNYEGEQALEGVFNDGVVIRAAPPYQARLRNSGPVLTLGRAKGITLEGFDIAHSGPGSDAFVVLIRDELGELGGADYPTRLVLRDNIIHDSFNDDLLRIDSGVAGVRIEGNIFYNQGPADEHIDINAARDVEIRWNILFNDFAASGRANASNSASFIIVKDADGQDDGIEGASDVEIDGNVFLSWQGDSSMNFVLLAERGHPIYGARRVTVQNNLMLGQESAPIRAPFGVKGASEVVFRSNTVVGDLMANAFAFRLNVEGDSPPNDGIRFFNNIWSAPGGSMQDLTDTEPASPLQDFELDTNLYWNGGEPIPVDSTDLVNVDSDPGAILGDPQLSAAVPMTPVWSSALGQFGGGEARICAAFEALVFEYGLPEPDGAGIGAARADVLPPHDILGHPRTGADIGAVERQ